MAAGIHIACIHPFCHLSVALGFSQPDLPGVFTRIYPFLGFEPLLEIYRDQLSR